MPELLVPGERYRDNDFYSRNQYGPALVEDVAPWIATYVYLDFLSRHSGPGPIQRQRNDLQLFSKFIHHFRVGSSSNDALRDELNPLRNAFGVRAQCVRQVRAREE